MYIRKNSNFKRIAKAKKERTTNNGICIMMLPAIIKTLDEISPNIHSFKRSAQSVKTAVSAASKPQETFINKKGEKLIIDYSAGKIAQAVKYNTDGDIIYLKKYIYDGDNHTVEIFRPDENKNMDLKNILMRTKETISRYIGKDGYLDKYFRKFGDK